MTNEFVDKDSEQLADEGVNELPEKSYAEQFMDDLLPDDAKHVRMVSVRDLAIADLCKQLKALTERVAELEYPGE